uniref:Ribonuclease H-like domain-containing protein n=1 Tax=Tanacetum cinerariifolium TaxID=118510 RepID=A0A699I9H6_TANCI|nr:ribonuclease H-like domain-containing protein [Tanacetum cinerariifolium]
MSSDLAFEYSSQSRLFHHKYLADDTFSRYKARLVANGSMQLEGIDVDEAFSLVVKPSTIWTVLSLATSQHWPFYQLDVKNAFIHGDLSETVYMHQHPGFRDSAHPDYVCLLQRSLYGIKQAPRAWFQRFAAYITRLGLLKQNIDSLHQEFSMMDLCSLNYILGIFVARDSSRMFLSQRKYATEILERAHMVSCNPSRTPDDTESKLGADGEPIYDPTLYRSLAGALQYLTFTSLNISYAVQQVCLYMHDPREPYFSALKWILSYVHVQQQRTYHIKIDIYFVRDLVAGGQVRVLHVSSRYQYADIFSKGPPSTLLRSFVPA